MATPFIIFFLIFRIGASGSKTTLSIFGPGTSSTIFNFFLPIFLAFVGFSGGNTSSCCAFNTGFIVTFVIPLFSNLSNRSFRGKAMYVSSTISGFPITTATGFLSPTTGLYFNFSFNTSKGFIAYIETIYKFFTNQSYTPSMLHYKRFVRPFV